VRHNLVHAAYRFLKRPENPTEKQTAKLSEILKSNI
jgi:hypothetical protein